RRHTRYIGYWSSDVCSSDLLKQRPEIRLETRRFLGRRPEFLAVCRVVVSNWGTRGSRGTETPARQPGTRVSPFQRGTDQGPRWDPECYPKTGVVEPCPNLTTKLLVNTQPHNLYLQVHRQSVIDIGWPLRFPFAPSWPPGPICPMPCVPASWR